MPAVTTFAVPLADVPVDLGAVSARISAVSAGTITLTGAAWAPGAFAPAGQNYAVHFLTGAAAGLVLPLGGNTVNALQVRGPDLTSLGLVTGPNGDAIEVLKLDTLDSLFGASIFRGGPDPSAADIITLGTYTRDDYYYNTTAGEWRRTAGPAINRGGIVVPPNCAVRVKRIGDAMTLTFLGRAPTTPYRASVLQAGNTFIGTGIATDVTLHDLALQNLISGWYAGSDVTAADTLSITDGGANISFFYNGQNWAQATTPAVNEDSRVISAGAALAISRSGAASGFTTLARPLPYTLALP